MTLNIAPGRPKQSTQQVSNPQDARLILPSLRPDQWAIAKHPAKIKVLAMGRRFGKTILAGCLALATAASGGRVAWIVPTYKNGRPLWRWAEGAVRELVKVKLAHVNRADRTITFEGGGWLGVYSADNPQSILGEAFHLVVVDEAARIPEFVWRETIIPTLADYAGDAVLISTPKGKNWFWQEWVRGRIPENWNKVKSWTASTAANPNPSIRAAFEEARITLDERTFAQEWLAEFIDSGGEVFHFNPDDCKAEPQEKPIDGHIYVMGIDWGKIKDYTVVTVVDVTTMSLIWLDRSRGLDYTKQIDRIGVFSERWKPSLIYAERNSAEALCEQLINKGLPVRPFLTTNATKSAIIQGLAIAFERGQIRIIPDSNLLSELSAFESFLLPSGMTQYAAPVGLHDDLIMSLAMCWAAAQQFGVPRIFFA